MAKRPRSASADRAWSEYLTLLNKSVFPKMTLSKVFMIVAEDWSGAPNGDTVRAATQAGYALLLGMPLLLLVPKGVTPPPGLVRAADTIVNDVDIGSMKDDERIRDALIALGLTRVGVRGQGPKV